MTTPELSYCTMKKTGNFIPQFRFFEDFQAKFNNVSIDCPMKPEKLYVNVTDYLGIEAQYRNPVSMTSKHKNGFRVRLPNGKYRFTVRIGTEADPNAVFVQWIREFHVRLYDDNF
jgi:hypothetical protein